MIIKTRLNLTLSVKSNIGQDKSEKIPRRSG